MIEQLEVDVERAAQAMADAYAVASSAYERVLCMKEDSVSQVRRELARLQKLLTPRTD